MSRSTIVLAAIALLATSATADETKKPKAETPEWFSRFDKNNDGVLDENETSANQRRLLDTDKNGVVTPAEARAYGKRIKERKRRGGRQIIQKADDLISRKKTGEGLWVVSIGHSCVVPAVEPTIAISRAAGFKNHMHFMQFNGGSGGAPRTQWIYEGRRQQAKPALESKQIDVMTFGHLLDYRGRTIGCAVEDYERWIDFAMKHNPEIKFYIQDLWPWLPGDERTVDMTKFSFEEYAANMKTSTDSLNDVVVALKKTYPDRIHVLPAGQAMTELVRRVSNKEVKGVDAILLGQEQLKAGLKVGLYRDKIHPTNLIASMQGYIYYACLYGKNPVDLEYASYDDRELYRVLREIAWETVIKNPYTGVKPNAEN